MKKVLDVGCGNTKIEGSIGIDRFKSSSVDFVHDLDYYPWPFADESFDGIVFSHSISHLNCIIKAMEECFRLLKPGGYVEIVGPHFASDNHNTDPTHRLHLGYRSMDYFCSNGRIQYRYIGSERCFEIISVVISFREAKTPWRKQVKRNPLKSIGIEALVNRYPRIYERLICWILPASEVYYTLRKPLNNLPQSMY
jgi:ubiquinone/menaquinone biosynthesis C-methylase UbiE